MESQWLPYQAVQVRMSGFSRSRTVLTKLSLPDMSRGMLCLKQIPSKQALVSGVNGWKKVCESKAKLYVLEEISVF